MPDRTIYCLNLNLSKWSKSPVTFKMKLYVTTVNKNLQALPIFCYKELLLLCCIEHSMHWGINPPPIYWFFMDPTLKIAFLLNSKNIKSFSYLTPSYLLKVTKFLVKISQFEFLVMTEKNIFVLIYFFIIKFFRF